ncbi:hypothetical protein AKUH3B203M01_00380 [Apilactobacillus kunkeei]|nr:hypothetical protein AKUH3B203M01_00380 [Apilactobacillus kunkeei]
MYKYGDTNISENYIREKNLNILKILLIDRTTSTDNKVRNIIWGNNNYIKYGRKLYSEKSQILPELITGINGNIIMPRALKDRYIKKRGQDQKQRYLLLLGLLNHKMIKLIDFIMMKILILMLVGRF